MIRAALLSLAMAAPAAAQSYAESSGLGDAVPDPEDSAMPGSVDFSVRLLDRQGRLLVALDRQAPVYVEISAAPVPDADFGGPFSCAVDFIDATGKVTPLQPLEPCPLGPQVSTGYTALGEPLRFFPEASDPAGTSGVEVTIKPLVGSAVELFVTFDWQGGR